MFDLSKRLKLRKGYDRVYRVTRYNRLMLTYEEVQRRLDRNYGGKLTIVEYSGVGKKGRLHCKECGEFTTKSPIGFYIRREKWREDCECCKLRARLERYTKLVGDYNLIAVNFPNRHKVNYYCSACNTTQEYDISTLSNRTFCKECLYRETTKIYTIKANNLGFIYKSRKTVNGHNIVNVECKICGYTRTVQSEGLDKEHLLCNNCLEEEKITEYGNRLVKHNCSYISHTATENGTIITYRCNICGCIGHIKSNSILIREGICSNCSETSSEFIKNESRLEAQYLCNTNGKILSCYTNASKVRYTHLFCGSTVTSDKNSCKKISCVHCSRKLNLSIPKEHNKHLVQEYLTILYNVKALKDFLVKHNQLQNVPKESLTILEHVDGWISNYELIIKKYPNKDLGTILENNQLYEKCRKVFYPVMERYNLEIKGD